MEKRVITAIFMAFLILSASTSPAPIMLNETFHNSTSNTMVQHNDRFVFFIPLLAPAISALASALGIAAAGTAAVGAGVLVGHAIDEAIHSGGGSSGGSSGGSPVGPSGGPSIIKSYEDLVRKSAAELQHLLQQISIGAVSLTALKTFDVCDIFRACAGVEPRLFGSKMYMGILVEKGQCPKVRTDDQGDVVAVVANALDEEVNPLTTSATLQFPPSGTCNKECCMLKKNLLPGSVCFDKITLREGQCQIQCDTDKIEISDSEGCESGQKCCGHHQIDLMG